MCNTKKCIVCNEDLFLDHSGDNYICMNGCQKVRKDIIDDKE